MEKAVRVIKRGSIKMMSYPHLNMIVSDLGEVRSAEKARVKAYDMLIADLIRWANQDSNEAIKQILALLGELYELWSGAHSEFIESLKNFKYQFDMLLENECFVDRAKDNLIDHEQIRNSIVKDLNKYGRKLPPKALEVLEEKEKEAQQMLNAAQADVVEKVTENEIVKMIRLKTGLQKLTEAQILLTKKCEVIVQAQKDIISGIPDLLGVPLEEIRYTDQARAYGVVADAKEHIRSLAHMVTYQRRLNIPTEYEAPPPYSPYDTHDHSDANKECSLEQNSELTNASGGALQPRMSQNNSDTSSQLSHDFSSTFAKRLSLHSSLNIAAQAQSSPNMPSTSAACYLPEPSSSETTVMSPSVSTADCSGLCSNEQTWYYCCKCSAVVPSSSLKYKSTKKKKKCMLSPVTGCGSKMGP